MGGNASGSSQNSSNNSINPFELFGTPTLADTVNTEVVVYEGRVCVKRAGTDGHIKKKGFVVGGSMGSLVEGLSNVDQIGGETTCP